jgi:hypothetical protein
MSSTLAENILGSETTPTETVTYQSGVAVQVQESAKTLIGKNVDADFLTLNVGRNNQYFIRVNPENQTTEMLRRRIQRMLAEG